MKLTRLDRAILFHFTRQLIVADAQLLALLPQSNPGKIPTRVDALIRAGFLATFSWAVLPYPTSTEPLATWSPADPLPDVNRLEWLAQSRWPKCAEKRQLFVSTKRASYFIGGFAGERAVKRHQLEHDLHMAFVFTVLAKRSDRDLQLFRAEPIFAQRYDRRKLPDALILDPETDKPLHCHESLGAYPKSHIESFFSHYPEDVPATLW